METKKQPETMKNAETIPGAPATPASAPKQLPKFAFLKVRSTPKGANVYINGSLKGTTPLTLKVGLGEYEVRLSRQGFKDCNRTIRIEKMTSYPVTEKMESLK